MDTCILNDLVTTFFFNRNINIKKRKNTEFYHGWIIEVGPLMNTGIKLIFMIGWFCYSPYTII